MLFQIEQSFVNIMILTAAMYIAARWIMTPLLVRVLSIPFIQDSKCLFWTVLLLLGLPVTGVMSVVVAAPAAIALQYWDAREVLGAAPIHYSLWDTVARDANNASHSHGITWSTGWWQPKDNSIHLSVLDVVVQRGVLAHELAHSVDLHWTKGLDYANRDDVINTKPSKVLSNETETYSDANNAEYVACLYQFTLNMSVEDIDAKYGAGNGAIVTRIRNWRK